MRVTDTATRAILANAAIIVKAGDSAKSSVVSLSEGYGVLLQKGTVDGIWLYNTGNKDDDGEYQAYKYVLPLGLTFADSVGIEDNQLFFHDATYTRDYGTWAIKESILKANGTVFKLIAGYDYPWHYFNLPKETIKNGKITRNKFFMFRAIRPNASVEYLELPQSCGYFDTTKPRYGNNYVFRDSLRYADGWFGVTSVGNYLQKQELGVGAEIGLRIRLPVSKTKRLPLMHSFGFCATDQSYKGFADVTNGPSFNSYTLEYGVSYFPFNNLVISGKLRPFFDVSTGPVLFTSSRYMQADSTIGRVFAKGRANFSWQYRIGGGLALQRRNFSHLSLSVYYGQALNARYYDINNLGNGNYDLKNKSAPFGAIYFRLMYSLRLI
jgi:hypothetical protein